ncbi:CREB-regulated transcription coactivator 1 isoform X11 [Apis cerana]|uniref:CREB-regulated transcription coactivator 1 isoform X11 n=1 Tax=Apis cerana TaxID=7461 RepID=UPI002B23AF9A|nr:CREB-regulated transcription coactivator 1 isoform X11 [Apis cerana]
MRTDAYVSLRSPRVRVYEYAYMWNEYLYAPVYYAKRTVCLFATIRPIHSASSSVCASPTGSGVLETPLSVKSAGASPPQSSGKHLHINLGNQFRAGGSLPNVNNNANCANDAKQHASSHNAAIHSIDLKDPPYRNNERGRSMGVGPMRSRPMEKRHDTSPYSGVPYLSPPPPDTWRRTNSDSALHQSANEACQSTTTIPHRRDQHAISGSGSENRNLHYGFIERPRSSCEIPRVPGNNIDPSSQPAGQQIPIGNTRSLPDLAHFQSDQEDHSSSTPFSNGSPLSYSNNPSAPPSPTGHPGPPNLTSESIDQNSYFMNQAQAAALQQDFEQFTMDWPKFAQQLMELGCTWSTQIEMDTPVPTNMIGTYIGSPNHTTSYAQNDTMNVGGELGSGDAGYFSTSPQVPYQPATTTATSNNTTTTQQLTPQTPNTPTIILTDFSGADDLTNPEFVKDLGSAMMGDFDPDIFPSDDALRQGLDPIDMDGLQMLTDPTMVISDPSAEAHFRRDRL